MTPHKLAIIFSVDKQPYREHQCIRLKQIALVPFSYITRAIRYPLAEYLNMSNATPCQTLQCDDNHSCVVLGWTDLSCNIL